MAEPVEVVTFRPRYAPDFAALNYQWIEQYFEVEAEDRKALENPLAYAIEPGGEIFFLLERGIVVGTVAMVPKAPKEKLPHAPRVYELAKMAVRPDCRGKGYGGKLMRACVDYAVQQGADEILLVTNDALGPALGLYRRAGFVSQSQYRDPRYLRGNLEMRLNLRDAR